MLDLSFNLERRHALRVLCIGAHCDDIEIGCGATLRMLQRGRKDLTIDWVVLSGSEERRKETLADRGGTPMSLTRTSKRSGPL